MADQPTPKRKIKRPPKPIAPEDKPLDDREAAFVREYLVRLQPMQAALAAGYSVTVAKTKAYMWVSNSQSKPNVYKAIQKGLEDRAQRTEITADMVLKRWWCMATADPNELTQHRRYACRHCFGVHHAYQWIDENEYEHALLAAQKEDGATLPSDDGGYGYDRSLPPHPVCPQCHGDGEREVYIADTRTLSEGAKTLFAGVKQTNQGLEIKMHDQAKALENVARHLGMFKDGLNLGVDSDNPLAGILRAVTGNTLKPGGDYPADDDEG